MTPEQFLEKVREIAWDYDHDIELTAQMKWNIAETISRIHDNGIVLGAGDFVDVDDLKYICQATSYLLLYAQQLEAERDALMKDLNGACWACKWANVLNGMCVTSGDCAWQWRGVQKEE